MIGVHPAEPARYSGARCPDAPCRARALAGSARAAGTMPVCQCAGVACGVPARRVQRTASCVWSGRAVAVANVSRRHSQPGVEAHCLLPVDSAVRRGIRFCVSVVVRLARIVCVGSVCVCHSLAAAGCWVAEKEKAKSKERCVTLTVKAWVLRRDPKVDRCPIRVCVRGLSSA